MKKIILILAVLMLAMTSLTFAQPQQADPAPRIIFDDEGNTVEVKATGRPTVAVLFVNKAKTTYDQELGDKLMSVVTPRLANFEVVATGEASGERLAKAGITDTFFADRSDIVAAFKDVDYVVWLELEQVVLQRWGAVLSEGINATVNVPLRIVDVKNNKYLYAVRFSEQADNKVSLLNRAVPVSMVGTKAASFAALEKVNAKLEEALAKNLSVVGAPTAE